VTTEHARTENEKVEWRSLYRYARLTSAGWQHQADAGKEGSGKQHRDEDEHNGEVATKCTETKLAEKAAANSIKAEPPEKTGIKSTSGSLPTDSLPPDSHPAV
jgi:hypothetical protein